MVGFILLGLGFFALREKLRLTSRERLSSIALVTGWAATGLTLPYYGGECFVLHALGKEALKRQDGTLISMASSVRLGQGCLHCHRASGAGVAAVLFAVAVAHSGWLPVGSVPLSPSPWLCTFLSSRPTSRCVVRGALMALGCSTLGVSMLVRPHRLQADLRREWPSRQVAAHVASGTRGSR
jgi:hypothetical protein